MQLWVLAQLPTEPKLNFILPRQEDTFLLLLKQQRNLTRALFLLRAEPDSAILLDLIARKSRS